MNGTKVNLAEAFARIDSFWEPRVAGELNGQQVRLAKIEGEFVWHSHEEEDELFLVVSGEMVLRMREREVELGPGEFFIVPRGVEHQPYAPREAHVLLLEPGETVNTGDRPGERTKAPKWLGA